MTSTNDNAFKDQGFSLIELMVALALSSILMIGLFQIFNSNQQAFGLQSGVARVQESGRIAMEFMARNVRAASFLGCASGEGSSPFTNSVTTSNYAGIQAALNRYTHAGAPSASTDPDEGTLLNSVVGFDDITAAQTALTNMGIQFNGTNAGDIVSNTDAFIIHGVEACTGTEGRVTTTTNGSITVSGSCGLQQNDIVVVSSCTKAEMFGVTSDPTTTTVFSRGSALNNGSTFIDGAFTDEGTYVYLPTIRAFHVGHTGNGDTALFMTSLVRSGTATSFQSQEIARGVYDLQVRYGEDTNGDGTVNRYVVASDVADFEGVIAIRTSIDTRSDDGVTSENRNYVFAGGTVTDRRLRASYETTNSIRNRLN